MRANTQNVQQGEQETRGAGEGRKKKKQCGTETSGDLWTGVGWGKVHRVNKISLQGLSGPDMTGTLRKERREFEGGGFGVD